MRGGDVDGSWKREETAACEPTGEDEVIPGGCARCFANPDVLSGLSGYSHQRTDSLVDDPHLGISLAECVQCGQPSLQIFEEEVDWTGGDDAQRYEIIAITARERAILRSAPPAEVIALAQTIGAGRVRMWWNWPTGGTKRAGRTALRYCPRCGKDVIAFKKHDKTVGRFRAALIRLLGGITEQAWCCRRCGSDTEPLGAKGRQ